MKYKIIADNNGIFSEVPRVMVVEGDEGFRSINDTLLQQIGCNNGMSLIKDQSSAVDELKKIVDGNYPDIIFVRQRFRDNPDNLIDFVSKAKQISPKVKIVCMSLDLDVSIYEDVPNKPEAFIDLAKFQSGDMFLVGILEQFPLFNIPKSVIDKKPWLALKQDLLKMVLFGDISKDTLRFFMNKMQSDFSEACFYANTSLERYQKDKRLMIFSDSVVNPFRKLSMIDAPEPLKQIKSLIDARVDQIQMDLEIASSYPAERENMVAKASEILKEIRFIVYSCFR